MHINYYYHTLLQINVIRAAYIALHTLYFREIIYLPFYLSCFFLCLQFKQKIGSQPQQPNPDDDDDDDDDDDTSAPSSTSEPDAHTASSTSADAAAATVPSTSTAGVSSKSAKKKVSTPARDPNIVQLLLHQES